MHQLRVKVSHQKPRFPQHNHANQIGFVCSGIECSLRTTLSLSNGQEQMKRFHSTQILSKHSSSVFQRKQSLNQYHNFDNVEKMFLVSSTRMGQVRSMATSSDQDNKDKAKETKVDSGKESDKAASTPPIIEKVKEKLEKVVETLKTKTQSIGGDETWEDGFRELLGMGKRKKKQQETPSPEKEVGKNEEKKTKDEDVLWYEAIDATSKKVYYYNDKGETRWKEEVEASGEEQNMKVHGKMESFYEKKISQIVKKIGELEKERDDAMSKSDMPLFKKINQQIRDLRKEIEGIGAKMNSTAIVEVEKEKTTWEKLADSVKDTKLGEQIRKIAGSETVKKIKETAEDAREVWETSQNPWIYRAHSAYDVVFSENEFGEALKAVRKHNPYFTAEDFVLECEEDILPKFINAFLQGDKVYLRENCSDLAYAFANAHIDQRVRDGRKKYPGILGIDNVRLYNFRVIDKVGPVAVIVLIAHQVDVEYDNEGKIVKGDENRIEGVPYYFAMVYETPDSSATTAAPKGEGAEKAEEEEKAKKESDGKPRWKVFEFSPSAGVAMLA